MTETLQGQDPLLIEGKLIHTHFVQIHQQAEAEARHRLQTPTSARKRLLSHDMEAVSR